MPELLGKRKWSVLQDMTYKQRVLLEAKLAQRSDVTPDECRVIAADLGVAFLQVCLHSIVSGVTEIHLKHLNAQFLSYVRAHGMIA